MANTTFVDNSTVIVASWLNDVNTTTYTGLPAEITRATAAEALLLPITTASATYLTQASLSASTGSTLIGTIQSGTGAVARTQAQKNNDTITTSDYSTESQSITQSIAQQPTGFYADGTGAKIQRDGRRMFFGDAVGFDANWGGSNNNYSPVPRWLSREAQVLSQVSQGKIGISGLSLASLGVTPPGASDGSGSYIGIVGVSVNDYSGTEARRSWGGYFESWIEGSVGSSTAAFGVEIDAGNNSSHNIFNNPFTLYGSYATTGLNISAGGSKGSSYANPTCVGLVIGNNTQTFNTGIIFGATAITGTNGLTGTGVAIAFAKGHVITWYDSTGQITSNIYSSVTTYTNKVSLVLDDNKPSFTGPSGQYLFTVEQVGATVNYPRMIPSVSGTAVEILSGGSDTDIDLYLSPKGAGNIKFGTYAASVLAVTGYITIKDSGGTVRRLLVG